MDISKIIVSSPLDSSRRTTALLKMSPYLTFQNLSAWVRAVSRVLDVGPSELSYYCACSLLKKSLPDLHAQTDSTILNMVIQELTTGIKKMYIPHIQALCQCINDQHFESTDTRYACVTFISLHCTKTNTKLSPNERELILSVFLNYFNNLHIEDMNKESSSPPQVLGVHTTEATSSSRFSKQDTVTMIQFLKECLNHSE